MKHTKQTRNKACQNGNRNPERILRDILPGIAKDCKLYISMLRNTITIIIKLLEHLHVKTWRKNCFHDWR